MKTTWSSVSQASIVSKKRSTLAKKTRRLEKAGYKATKGKFGVKKVKKGGAEDEE